MREEDVSSDTVNGTRPSSSMTSESMSSFFADAGFKVHSSESADWYEAGARFMLSLPSHRSVVVSEAEAKRVLRDTGAVGLRYVTDVAEGSRESYQIVAKGADYCLENLASNARSKIRRGLKRHELARISGEELETAGLQAFMDTLDRQDRRSRSSLESWKRLLRAADRQEAVEIWGAWHGDTLAAYLMIFLIDDVCEFYQGRSRNDYLKHYPNNALVYYLTEEMLAKRGLREVTYGLESLEPVSSVDAFKWSMGFERKPIFQRVVFHPAVNSALRIPGAPAALRWMGSRESAGSFWRKARGLVDFAGY